MGAGEGEGAMCVFVFPGEYVNLVWKFHPRDEQ